VNSSMEETEPAISEHSPEQTEKGKDKPNEKEAENGGQEQEEEEEGNEKEGEDKADTNKDDDQEEEEEDDGDQREEEADEGPLKASSTPKKRKRNEKSKMLKSAPPKKRRKNNTSHQQKEEEDPAEILNVWKRKLVPGLPAAKPIHWCHGKKSHAKSGKRGEHRGGRKLGQLHHDKKYDREGSFRTGACSGGCLSSESTQRDLGKMGCSPSEGKHERVVCLQIAGPLQHLGPVSTLPILVHPCFKDDSVQRENPSPSPERPCIGCILAGR